MTESELLKLAEQERRRRAAIPLRVGCCTSGSCIAKGAGPVLESFRKTVADSDTNGEVLPVGCLGPCSLGPLAWIEASGQHRIYQRLTPEVAPATIEAARTGKDKTVRAHVVPPDIPFFRRQLKIVTSNIGRIDPERIEDYIAEGGYAALAKVLREQSPAQVCEEIVRSGLRGRGGAGYPTGVKWNLVRKSTAGPKYVIANGDEGDPGAFMDRAVMESDPHRLLEGMAIAAYGVGADHGYIYVRGEYPIAIERLTLAATMATRLGILGESVLGTRFSFHVEIRIGAGAFVCGEETALIASVEGGRGTPHPRPPYPAESGVFGMPTLINNVETLAAVPSILARGAEWYASIGTPNSKGTKVFALSGNVAVNGLIEVPMGITLREIIFDLAGGVPDGKKFKAVQTGGPSGGCIPEEFLDTPVEYESLSRLGSIMGSGGMIVMDESTSMVDLARFFMGFCRDESCGKCLPCRVGTVQLHRMLEKILNQQATLDDLDLLEDLCDVVKHTSLCGLGQAAPNPVLSTLKFFRHEYMEKIGEGRRPRSERTPLPLLGATP